MHPLNPFLRAFFRSTLPSQCSPAQHHILLVPTTDVLLYSRDRESRALYSDLASSEEFLASHVLRVPGGVAPTAAGKDGGNFRENRGKAKQYTTVNGRTVIIKDTFVYSNKGFKTLNQAQLLNDIIFYPDSFDSQPWLVYYISRPLIGSYEALTVRPAVLGKSEDVEKPETDSTNGTNGSTSALPKKKEVKNFSDLLNHFPMIARQMQPGLERLFKEFAKEFEKPLPPVPTKANAARRRSGSASSVDSVPMSLQSSMSNGISGTTASLELGDEEDLMRRSLETAVTAAIDLFQMVDKQQLSLLGATTDLTGPLVERMIERYVAEQVHDTILFPRISNIRRFEDLELEARLRQMVDVDVTQVGITIEDGQRGKHELAIRLSKGANLFKKMGVASSPQEMMDILLHTQKLITTPETVIPAEGKQEPNGVKRDTEEKTASPLTINADTLVSLLLVVVIRSSVRHLWARLSYMRHFIFIDDVESGEMGYALSTFEAVLLYLARNSRGLRKSSRRNNELWEAIKVGDPTKVRAILDPIGLGAADGDADDEAVLNGDSDVESHQLTSSAIESLSGTTINDDLESLPNGEVRSAGGRGALSHVFPFQRATTPGPEERPKIKKRVSMDMESTSSVSGYSFHSRTDAFDSRRSSFANDTSTETLAATHGPGGDSLLMMAIESGKVKILSYLLSQSVFYPIEEVLEDWNNDGTTLLSSAVQAGQGEIIDTLLHFIFEHTEDEVRIKNYISLQDTKGRCVGHYLFNAPQLIQRLAHLIPWRLKDKNGATPLFALCRSYDHEQYQWMVDTALTAATEAQGDGFTLHLDDHIDNKGNTLLHIVNDPQMALRILYQCDSNVNAANDKHFTPLMVASKYGRTDLVRALFGDPRVDLQARDLRGLTAVELAKDDEVRNRIDDLVLLSNRPSEDQRITTVVRSFFVDDGTMRLVLKSGAPNGNSTITVTTCRRSVSDFESLRAGLALENPASWLPSVAGFQSPFLIPSKPSRALLRDTQIRLDNFLRILLAHSTFSTHQMVWEFFLVPDIDPTMLAERSKRLAEARADRVREEYDPINDVREVELFVQHARESVRGVHHSTKSVLRRTNKVRFVHSDLADAAALAAGAVGTVKFLPNEHVNAFERYTKTLSQAEFSPLTGFYYSTQAISITITAILESLRRPTLLIGSMSSTQKSIERHTLSLRRNDRWPLGLLDDTRHRMQQDAAEKVDKSVREMESLGRELRYTQQTVVGELAAWQEERVKMGRHAVREMAKRMVIVEKDRLEGMRRAVRGLGLKEKT